MNLKQLRRRISIQTLRRETNGNMRYPFVRKHVEDGLKLTARIFIKKIGKKKHEER
jgi:hypothetical protein